MLLCCLVVVAVLGLNNDGARCRRRSSLVRRAGVPPYYECEGSETAEWFARARTDKKVLIARRAVSVESLACVEVDVIAGLALEEGVASRLVCGEEKRVALGPFDEARLADLNSETGWSILVNDVDLHLPEVAALRESISREVLEDPTPTWRRDDVMASVSTEGGGVGPHVDTSEVVLVQAVGRRRWSVETRALDAQEAERRLDPTKRTRCLVDFLPDGQWDLEPGDLLYVPARVPHDGHGITDDALSITLSLGYRELTARELASRWCDDATLEESFGSRDVEDVIVDLNGGAGGPAEITVVICLIILQNIQQCSLTAPRSRPHAHIPAASPPAPAASRQPSFLVLPAKAATTLRAAAAVRAALEARLNDEHALARWLGEIATEPRNAAVTTALEQEEGLTPAAAMLSLKACSLRPAAGTRLAYSGPCLNRRTGEDVLIFCVNGLCQDLPPRLEPLAMLLSSTDGHVVSDPLNEAGLDPTDEDAIRLLKDLLRSGSIIATRRKKPNAKS